MKGNRKCLNCGKRIKVGNDVCSQKCAEEYFEYMTDGEKLADHPNFEVKISGNSRKRETTLSSPNLSFRQGFLSFGYCVSRILFLYNLRKEKIVFDNLVIRLTRLDNNFRFFNFQKFRSVPVMILNFDDHYRLISKILKNFFLILRTGKDFPSEYVPEDFLWGELNHSNISKFKKQYKND